MAKFTGQLRSNEIFGALFNMIISQEIDSQNIAGTFSELVDKARVDGGLYGDTKLYYSTDVLKSSAWGNDKEAANLLALHRPAAPEVQAITLDKFRQIALTVDDYLSKRAFSTEGAFSNFNSVLLSWIRDTKRVYDATTYNAFIGTAETDVGAQAQSIDLTTATTGLSGLDKARVEGLTIAQSLADLIIKLKDVSRDFNDYGNLRSYSDGDIKVIWNSDFVNKIRKVDLPTIFHSEGLVDKFDSDILPARYFGKINAAETAVVASGDGANAGKVRSLIEQEIGPNHYFPGDVIKTGDTAPAGTSYTVDPTIICKIYTKLPPYMSAFETSTSFFNPVSLTSTNWLIWGYNTLEYLKGYPLITVREK